jgi:MoxR-like ATPase
MEVQAQEDIPARFSQLEQRLSHAEAHCGDWVKEEADYCANHLFVGKREKEAMSRILGEPSKALFRYRNELEEMKHAYRKENEEYPSERPENSLFGATS